MPGYSISDLEKLSGVKAHTIRIWEKRYGILVPSRTGTNIRYYDNSQLKKLLNVTTLMHHGFKISQLAALPDEVISAEIRKLLNTVSHPEAYDMYVTELLLSAVKYDEPAFEKTFHTCVLKFGFTSTIEYLLYPLLNRVGILWRSDDLNPAQEHFLSNLIRKKFLSAIDAIPVPEHSAKKFLLFLPEHEEHEIGLLYADYFLLKKEIRTYYMGQRLPFENLLHAVSVIRPTHLLLFLVMPLPPAEIQQYIDRLSKSFPAQQVLVCGNNTLLTGIRFPVNTQALKEIADLQKFI